MKNKRPFLSLVRQLAFDFESPAHDDFDQELDAIEQQAAVLRRVALMSPKQREAFLLAGRVSLVEAYGKIMDEAAVGYTRARRGYF